MDQSPIFARHFSRLVWLMINEGSSVDDQKMSLRALVTVTKSGAVSLAAENWELRAGDEPVPNALTGVQDVTSRMAAHSIRAVQVEGGATAADLLGFARILAAEGAQNDGGAHVTQKLAALGAGSIRITTIPAVAGRPSVAAPAPAAKAAEAVTAAEPVTAPTPPSNPAQEAPTATSPLPPPVAATPTNGATLRASASALLAQLSGKDITTLTPEQLIEALDASKNDTDASTKILDDLVTLAEHSARIGKPKVVADILHGIVSRDTSRADEGVKKAFVMAVRRLSKPALLRAVAGLVVKYPERKQSCYDVLRATGEDGAEALIEQVAQARTTEERQSLLEVLGELPDAVTALKRMLGDSRWFVVRNAADLLGEMAAKDAEEALVGLLRHTDDRVRRSATNALLKVGTPDAVKGVYEAVGDSSPEVRMQAAASLSTRKDGKTAATLIRAIEGENDADVQFAMIAALGKVATTEAVQKLVKLAEPEGRLFRKKSPLLRVAAVQALGEARTPVAINALKGLADDKDKEVRETAARALAQVSR